MNDQMPQNNAQQSSKNRRDKQGVGKARRGGMREDLGNHQTLHTIDQKPNGAGTRWDKTRQDKTTQAKTRQAPTRQDVPQEAPMRSNPQKNRHKAEDRQQFASRWDGWRPGGLTAAKAGQKKQQWAGRDRTSRGNTKQDGTRRNETTVKTRKDKTTPEQTGRTNFHQTSQDSTKYDAKNRRETTRSRARQHARNDKQDEARLGPHETDHSST